MTSIASFSAYKLRSCQAHFFMGFSTPFFCDREGSIRYKRDFKTLLEGIQDAGKHTYILSQTTDRKVLYAIFPQLYRQAGLVKNRVLVLVKTYPFGNYERVFWKVQVRMETGAMAILNAVRRPEPTAFNETDMMKRVPIAGSINGNAFGKGSGDPTVKHRDDAVTLGNG